MFGFLVNLAKVAVSWVGKAVASIAKFGAKVVKVVKAGVKKVAAVVAGGVKWLYQKVSEWWRKVSPEAREKIVRHARKRLEQYYVVGWNMVKHAAKRIAELPVEDQEYAYGAMYHNIEILSSRLHEMLKEDSIQDFEEHLRLRGSLKFLKDMMQRLDDKTVDTADLRLLSLIEALAKGSPLSDADLDDLDYLVRMKYGGRSALALAVEQLLSTWAEEQRETEKTWHSLLGEISRVKLEISELQVRQEVEGVTELERLELLDLKVKLERLEKEKVEAERRLDDLTIVIGAGEGLLEVYEETETSPIMRRHAESAAKILLAFDRGEELTDNMIEYLRTFASVYSPKARERSSRLLAELTVGAPQ